MVELARVRTVITGFSGAPGISTQYFLKTGSGAWSAYDDLMVSRVTDAWSDISSLLPTSHVATTLAEIDIIEDTTGEIQQTISATNDGVSSGTADSPWLPTASGYCVTWRTDGVVAGKHVRGRTFLVPVAAVGLEADGSPTASALALVGTYAQTMTGLATSVALAIWSRPKTVPDSNPTAYIRFGSSHQVTDHTISDKFAVLRSRRD
jgi:hypothetical protein